MILRLTKKDEMIKYKRTNSDDRDFLRLVAELDEDLRRRDGDEHVFYAQLNKTDGLPTCIVGYEGEQPVACGAIRRLDETAVEVKRMYVVPHRRGKGVAAEVLVELEKWAIELGYRISRLETGQRQPEAIALYKKSGYSIVENFGKYVGVENSVCFEKTL